MYKHAGFEYKSEEVYISTLVQIFWVFLISAILLFWWRNNTWPMLFYFGEYLSSIMTLHVGFRYLFVTKRIKSYIFDDYCFNPQNRLFYK